MNFYDILLARALCCNGGGASPCLKSASGDIITITDGADNMPLFSAVVNIEPVQSGSGDPSPTNIRPISGWTQVNVWVKPTYDTSLTPTATIPLGRTVYGGTLDVVRGKLVVDRGYATITSFSKKNGATRNNIYENQTIRDLIAKPAADANVVDLLSNAFVKCNFGSTGGLYGNDKIGIASSMWRYPKALTTPSR